MSDTDNRLARNRRTTLQRAAQAMGVVFLLVGILGFIPGITSNYDTLQFAGHESEALLLGIFQVSVVHNIVHLLFGIAGLAMARTVSGAYTYLLGGGIVYAVLFIYGLVVGHHSTANFVPLNAADNVLHVVLAIAMIGLSLGLGKKARSEGARV